MENKKRILLVDDEATITRTLGMYLEATGKYEVLAENRGAEALRVAGEFKPNLILLDVVMPDIDGAEVAEKIREDASLRETPIIFLTALVKREEVGPDGTVGGYPFIAKPLDPDEIIECIEQYAA